MELKGLPEGLETVRWGAPQPGDYYLAGRTIQKCEGAGYEVSLIVAAASGWSFYCDPPCDAYGLTRNLEQVAVVTVQFRAENKRQLERIRESCEYIGSAVGCEVTIHQYQ